MNNYTIKDITRASGGFAMYSAAKDLIPICISFDTDKK